MFSKSKNYYFKQQFEPLASPNAKSKNATNKHAGYGNPQYSGFSYDAKDYPLGRNKRDVWHVTTKGYKGAHFAVFNPEWIRPCIQAGCPTEICDICDEPVRFIIEKGEPLREWQKSCGGDQNGNYTGENTKDYASAKAQPASDLKRRVLEGLCVKKQVRNPCDCENATFQPGIVLDPFLGSGTTAMVAAQEKCQFAGIELNTEYVQIILDRINSAR